MWTEREREYESERYSVGVGIQRKGEHKNSGEAQENDDGEKNITAVQKARTFLSLNHSSAMFTGPCGCVKAYVGWGVHS